MFLLALTAWLFGLRHGVDWDHLAAIGDLTSAGGDRRQALRLASWYAAGHGAVVLVLGVAAVLGEPLLPAPVDAVMGRVVGVTLVVLAASVVVGLVRDRGRFRMRSRFGVAAGLVARVRARVAAPPVLEIEHEHEHDHAHGPDHGHRHPAACHEDGGGSGAVLVGHRHVHRHRGRLPADPFGRPTPLAAAGVGVLHGIGAETPTQVVVFLAAAHVRGTLGGVALLLCFLTGLLASNTAVAIVAGRGLLDAGRNFRRYAALATLNALASVVIGGFLLAGLELPPILGG